MLRTSERSSFKKCRQQWWWSYVDQLKPRHERTALAFGTLAHRVLELRYKKGRKRGPHPAKIAKKVWAEYLAAGGEEFTLRIGNDDIDAGEFLVHMFENYYDEYGDDERYEVIASEHTFAVDVFHPKSGKFLFTYVGTIDGVWRDLHTDKIVFAEHKTGAGLDPFGAPIYLDEQQAAYWAYGPIWLEHQGILKPGEKIDHVLYNRLRKGKRDERPRNEQGHYLNQNGTVSKNQGTPLFKREIVLRTEAERAKTMRRVLNEFREMQMVKSGRLAVYKSPDRHCGYCSFRDMCEVEESGEDWEALRDGTMKIWNPYDDHEMEDLEHA